MTTRNSAARGRDGFSLVEALLAMSITAVAGGALLTSLAAAVQSSTEIAHAAVARGMADQLMDEISATRFPTGSGGSPSGSNRLAFDDLDDHAGYSERPPADRAGHPLGTEGYAIFGIEIERLQQMRPDDQFIGRFTRTVQVERVQPSGNGGWTTTSQTSDYRRVTIRVLRSDRRNNMAKLAEISRIFSNVPVTP